jgi:hypothetical protein
LAINTFSNSQGSNACMSPFRNWITIVVPIPTTRIGSGHERWRTQSPPRNSCCMQSPAQAKGPGRDPRPFGKPAS